MQCFTPTDRIERTHPRCCALVIVWCNACRNKECRLRAHCRSPLVLFRCGVVKWEVVPMFIRSLNYSCKFYCVHHNSRSSKYTNSAYLFCSTQYGLRMLRMATMRILGIINCKNQMYGGVRFEPRAFKNKWEPLPWRRKGKRTLRKQWRILWLYTLGAYTPYNCGPIHTLSK